MESYYLVEDDVTERPFSREKGPPNKNTLVPFGLPPSPVNQIERFRLLGHQSLNAHVFQVRLERASVVPDYYKV